jgi:hypothetical protein
MNIFLLDKDTTLNAQYHTNKHVTKMIVETSQMLCTAHFILDGTTDYDGVKLYRPTHKNHPSAVWIRKSKANYLYARDLLRSLITEYDYRYGIDLSKYSRPRKFALMNPPNNILDIPFQDFMDFPMAMPDELRIQDDPVQAYRNYYNRDKSHLHSWTKR